MEAAEVMAQKAGGGEMGKMGEGSETQFPVGND